MNHRGFTLLALLALLLFRTVGFAQTPQAEPKAGAAYEMRADHDPDGTGKFYRGREIAYVMSYHGAGWLERPEREKEEQTSKLLPSLEIKPGNVVADLGAGSGYYTFRMAPLVGPKGKVIALDIQPEMLEIIRKRSNREQVANVEIVKNTEKSLKLPANSVDLFLMVDVYHELSHPYEMTADMVRALKPGGRLVFVEYRREDDSVPIKLVHKMTEKQVLKEMTGFPLRHEQTLRHLPWQHVIIFSKQDDARAPATSPGSTPAPAAPGAEKDRPR